MKIAGMNPSSYQDSTLTNKQILHENQVNMFELTFQCLVQYLNLITTVQERQIGEK